MTGSSSQNYGFYDFEYGEGPGWIKESFGGHEWTLDLTQGYNNSSTSMKSTDLGKGAGTLGLGASSIRRTVDGPAYIAFWWKSRTSPSECGELSFLVNDEEKSFHGTSIWTPQLYYLPENISYTIEWRYMQKDPKLHMGCGWIDDISIASSFQDLYHNSNLKCSICAPDVAKIGSTCNASGPLIDGADYIWSMDGGEIIGSPNNQSVICNFESNSSATLKLEISKPNLGSALCSKNIAITPRNWPYSNCSIQELSNMVKWPQNNTTYVDAKYDPFNYTYMNVSDAINNVTWDGTVIIKKGLYTENIVINKPIDLRGLDRNNTTIVGKGHAICIVADGVTINNLTILGGYYGIQVYGSRCYFINLNLLNCEFYGINFMKSDYSNVTGCHLRNNDGFRPYEAGIYCYLSNHNSFIDNSFSDMSSGLVLYDSNHNFIDNNIFSFASEGISLENQSSENNITCTNKFNDIKSDKRIIVKNNKLINHISEGC